MNKRIFLLSCLLVVALVLCHSVVAAGPHSRDLVVGSDDEEDEDTEIGESKLTAEIDIEKEEKQENPYKVAQDGAIDYFKALHGQMNSLALGKIEPVPNIGLNIRIHLTGVYLYCSVVNGTCPVVLDAILETDIINSRISKKPRCNNMLRFWKAWKDGDMQKKHGHAVKTGFINKTQEFRKKVLPRYYRCKSTVAAEIALAKNYSDQRYFSSRYGADSVQKDAVLQLIDLLEKTKRDVPNVFRAVNIRSSL